jgi:hypothetical protein
MNSEPPVDVRRTRDQEATAPDASDAGRQGGNGKRSWSAFALITGILVVATAVGSVLYLTQGTDSETESEPPGRALACPYLQQAADARERRDRLAYTQAVDRAAQVAERALQKSGQVFGVPERIALELALANRPDIATLLRRADDACSAASVNREGSR